MDLHLHLNLVLIKGFRERRWAPFLLYGSLVIDSFIHFFIHIRGCISKRILHISRPLGMQQRFLLYVFLWPEQALAGGVSGAQVHAAVSASYQAIPPPWTYFCLRVGVGRVDGEGLLLSQSDRFTRDWFVRGLSVVNPPLLVFAALWS